MSVEPSAEPADATVAEPAKPSRRSNRRRGERSERPAATPETVQVVEEKAPAVRETSLTGGGVVEAFPAAKADSGRRNRGGRDREDRAPSVTGFGDEVPAFLLKAVAKKATG